MKARQNKHKQMSIFNNLSIIPTRQINWLITTWAFSFRLFIYPLIKPDLFDCLYSNVDSRPATPPQITVSLLLIQAMFNKTDDEMHDWMMGADIAIRFATDTLGYDVDKLPTCDKQLSRFRMRCQEYAASHDGYNPLDECLLQAEYGICALMGLDLKNVRMDSTQVSANMARLSRESLVYTANYRMLKYLMAQNAPEIRETIDNKGLGHYLEANDKNKVIYHSHFQKEDKQKKLAEEADRILEICTSDDLASEEGKLYTRILSEQTIVEDGIRRFAKAEDKTMTSKCVQNPVDPEATFRKKAGEEFIGYVTNFAEAVGTCGSQIVSWDFEQNVVNDSVMAMAFLKQAQEIVSGIESYNRAMNIEAPGDMKKCQAVLQEKMKLVHQRIHDAVKSGQKIPRSMDLDPLYEEKEENQPSEDNCQMTMEDLLKDLGINITEQETSSGSEEKRADSSKSSTPLVEKIRESFDSTPLTFNEETVPESNKDGNAPESVNESDTSNNAGESSISSENQITSSGHDTNTEIETSGASNTSVETAESKEIRIIECDGRCYINDIDAEEYAKRSDFAFLPDEIRRQAIINLIHRRQTYKLSDLGEKPVMVADGAYSEDQLARMAADNGFILLSTDLFGKPCNPMIGLFVLDESRTNVIRCPMGEACKGKVNKNGSVTVKIEGNRCEHCPFRNDCKTKYQPRLGTYSFIVSPHAYDRIHTEAFLGSEDYKCVGRFRNGVETVPNMLHNYFDVDEMPLGQTTKKFWISLKVMAANIRKFFAFVKGEAYIADNPLIARNWA